MSKCLCYFCEFIRRQFNVAVKCTINRIQMKELKLELPFICILPIL
jgi:hypothetical protein